MFFSARRASIAIALLAAAACTPGYVPEAQSSSTGSAGSTGSGIPVPPGKAMVRVVHASPDAPSVDVYAKGIATPVITGLSYGNTSAYLELDPGTYDLELRASPSTASDPVAYSTGPLAIAEGDKYTTIAAGLLASPDDSSKFRVLALAEHFGIAGSGNAIVRIVHAGSDAPSVDIDLDDNDPASPDITGLDRFTDTGDWGVPITAGSPRQIGIDKAGARVTAFTTPALPEGAELFVIATGELGKRANAPDGFDLLAVGPSGSIGFIKQNPIVVALHDGPDAPAVDAFVGNAEIVDNLSFGNLSGALRVPPGNYSIDFFAHTDGGARPAGPAAATASTGALEAGERYLTIATGFLAPKQPGESFRLVSVAEAFQDVATGGTIRVVHASPDAPAVDIGVLNAEKKVSPVLVADLMFGNASTAPGFTLSSGTTPIGVAAAGTTDPVASFHVPVTDGVRAFAIASGALDPAMGQSFRLLVVDTSTWPWTAGTIQPQPKQ